MATLEELQVRIQRLDDVKQIERLQRIYGYYRDYGEWEKVVDLFSDSAESVEVADHGVYQGKAGVKRYYIDLIKGGKNAKPRPGVMSIALQLQGVVTLAPDGQYANGRFYGFIMEARPTLTLHDGELGRPGLTVSMKINMLKKMANGYSRNCTFFLTSAHPTKTAG